MKIAFLTTDNREQFADYDNPDPFFGTAPTAVLEGFSLLGDQVEIHVISCTKKRMSSPAKLASNIWFHQPLVSHLGWGRSLFLGCAWSVRRLLNRLQPDIVHGQGTERGCAMAAVLSGYCNVLTIHGIMQTVAKAHDSKPLSYYGMISMLERFAIGRSCGVLCNSAYTEGMISPLARTTWRVPNAIRSAFLVTQPQLETRKRRIVVLGSIIHYKQSIKILRIWLNLAARFPDVLLTFIGPCAENEYGREFRSLRTNPLLTGRTEHFDWLECEDLIRLLDSSRGMIHFPTEESFGLAVVEGLARNLKLFAGLTGGVPDAAHGCVGVEFFAADDWEGLSAGICRWIEQGMPILDTAPSIEQRFSPITVARQHIDIYREVLGS